MRMRAIKPRMMRKVIAKQERTQGRPSQRERVSTITGAAAVLASYS
jgi:hypothetical protein